MIHTVPNIWRSRFTKALVEGDKTAASQVVDELIAAHHPAGEVYRQIFAPALYRLGEFCCESSIDIGREKLGTQIVLRLMERLRVKDDTIMPPATHRVMVCCAEGEDHSIGARMAADLFLGEGWSVDFLGANVPDTALLEMVKSRQPQLLGLSATLEPGEDHARRVMKALAELSDPPKILLGGQGLAHQGWNDERLAVRAVKDVVEGLDAARSLLSDQPKAVLREYLVALGRRVREIRLRAGLTQEQVADAARVTRVFIVGVESGKQNVSMDVIVRVANALKVSPDRLLVSSAPAGLTRRGAI